MWNKWERWANETIPQPSEGVVLQKKDYRLSDISKQCRATFQAKNTELREFAKAFPPNIQGLHMLFDFCDHFFEYKADKAYNSKGDEIPVQALQSPATMWKHKIGDCKSYTVFIQSCITWMGLPGEMMLVDYGNPTEKHIYPNAIIKNRRIPLDVVYKKEQGGAFATEKQPFKMIEKIISKPGLYTVGAIPKAATAADLERYANSLNSEFSMPGGVDITTFTKGEFDRWQLAERLKAFDKHESDQKLKSIYRAGINTLQSGSIAGIGEIANTDFGKRLNNFLIQTSKDNAPAFANPTVALPPLQVDNVGGLFSGIKKVIKKVGDAIGNALKTIANVFHKDQAKDAAPFFLYQFLSPGQLSKAKPEVRRRHASQQKALAHMEKKGKLGTKQQILNSMATGIKSQYGVMPEEILSAATSQKVGVVAAAATAATYLATHPQIFGKAFNILKGIGAKIVSIFKKKDKDDNDFEALSSEANSSDLNLLFEASGGGQSSNFQNEGINPTKNLPATTTNRGGTSDSSGGGSMMWIGLAVAAAAAFALKK